MSATSLSEAFTVQRSPMCRRYSNRPEVDFKRVFVGSPSVDRLRLSYLNLCSRPIQNSAAFGTTEDFLITELSKSLGRSFKLGIKVIDPTIHVSVSWESLASPWIGMMKAYCHPLSKWREKIRAFFSLPKGWDSYDSEAPSQTAIESAISVIDQMELFGVEPNWCIPTSDDSILLEFEWSDITYKWELESDGDIGVMIKPLDGEPVYLDLQAKQIAEFFADHCHGAL